MHIVEYAAPSEGLLDLPFPANYFSLGADLQRSSLWKLILIDSLLRSFIQLRFEFRLTFYL